MAVVVAVALHHPDVNTPMGWMNLGDAVVELLLPMHAASSTLGTACRYSLYTVFDLVLLVVDLVGFHDLTCIYMEPGGER